MPANGDPETGHQSDQHHDQKAQRHTRGEAALHHPRRTATPHGDAAKQQKADHRLRHIKQSRNAQGGLKVAGHLPQGMHENLPALHSNLPFVLLAIERRCAPPVNAARLGPSLALATVSR